MFKRRRCFGWKVRGTKTDDQHYVFFTNEISNHQISISLHQNAGKPMMIQMFNASRPRKFVVKKLNKAKVGPLEAKIEEIRFKSAFSLDVEIAIFWAETPRTLKISEFWRACRRLGPATAQSRQAGKTPPHPTPPQ